jgi:transcription elongation factor GreA
MVLKRCQAFPGPAFRRYLQERKLAAPDPPKPGAAFFPRRAFPGRGLTTQASVEERKDAMTLLDEIRHRIDEELGRLDHELRRELPERIGKALEMGDLRENAEHKSAIERQQFVQARISHLSQRLSELSKIDVKNLPPDRVGFGSKVTVKDLDSTETLKFTIVAGDFLDLDAGEISLASPIGRGLLGARMEQEVAIDLPMGQRRYRVLELLTLPEQLDLPDGDR